MPDAPGSGALNAGYAVTYDNSGDMQRMNFVNMLQQQNEARQQRAEAQRRADEAHKYALQKYYGAQFDPSKFDTETDLNKSINEELMKGRKSLAEVLSKPGVSDQDIENATQQALVPAQKLYQIGTAVKRNIDASLEGLKGDKGIDLGSLKTQAYVNALYTKDPQTGKLRLRNEQELSQVDPEHNYAADLLQNHPELVAKGDVDWSGAQKLFVPKEQELSGAHYTSPGVKSKHDFKATWFDGLQDLVRDDKGVYHVTTVSDPIITKDANGKEVKIDAVPQSVINTMQPTLGAKAKLDVATMQYLAKHSPEVSVEPGTPAFENAKRVMVHEMMKPFAAKKISDKSDVTKSSLLTRIELGYPMPGSGSDGGGGDQAADTRASFNDITDTPFVGDNGMIGSINNGQFEQKKGVLSMFTPKYDGREIIGSVPLDKLPASVFNAVSASNAKNDITGETKPDENGKPQPTGFARIKVKGGQISAIKTDKGWFDVDSRQNANIKIQNSTTTMKNKQHYNLPDVKKKKKDPLGIF